MPAAARASSLQDPSDLAGGVSSHSQVLSAGHSRRCLPGNSRHLPLLQRPPLPCLQWLLPLVMRVSQGAAWDVPLLDPPVVVQSPYLRMPDSAQPLSCLPGRGCCPLTLPTLSLALQAGVWVLPLRDPSGWEGNPWSHMAASGHPTRCPLGVCRSPRPSVQWVLQCALWEPLSCPARVLPQIQCLPECCCQHGAPEARHAAPGLSQITFHPTPEEQQEILNLEGTSIRGGLSELLLCGVPDHCNAKSSRTTA